jgi:D-serine deaminase-like pyridoxal phosphate-dependent protein
MRRAPWTHPELCGLLRGEPLPCALVDLGALERNLARLLSDSAAASRGKTLRIASKSVRCVRLLRHALERGGTAVRGLMTYSASETEFLARHGFDDLLLAYPTLQPPDLQALATLAAEGRSVWTAVDSAEQAEALGRAAARLGTVARVVLDVDLSWRPLPGLHVGVRRSPVRTPEQAVELGRRLRAIPGVELAGLLAYEAHIAGLPDASPHTRASNPLRRLLKRLSLPDVVARRAAIVEALRAEGFALRLVNGGGTGSVRSTSAEAAVTEATIGSGLYCPHLFDGYAGLELQSAAFFALQAVRRSDDGFVTCNGGGYVASGGAGPDRLPQPCLPEGLELLGMEGAGEVQTPLRVRKGALAPEPGSPVLFRHAKAGELCEHFNELLLVRDGAVVERAPTYRGEGRCFL